MSNTGWDRSLGTSKKEQGIITPPHPTRRNCGCWFVGTNLVNMCQVHEVGMKQMMAGLQKEALARRANDISEGLKKKGINKK